MRRNAHFPWRKPIGIVLLLFLLLPLVSGAMAATRNAVPTSLGDNPSTRDVLRGPDEKEPVPNVTPTAPEGDPDDFGRIVPLIERMFFLLSLSY